MGEVYCAEHEALRRKYAIKVLKTDVAAEPVLVERFRREARAASRFDHPNIVYIADFGQMENGRLYLAMEYTAGQSLQDEIDDLVPKRLSQTRVLEILFQVTDAIAAAHKANVVHRDLKPDNILLTQENGQSDRVKILDFGMAKILGDSDEFQLTRKGEIFGTPAFISPEQARGDTVDHRADIYALGVMMFELLCGRLPFEHENITRMLIAQQEEEPPRPSSFLKPSEQPIPIVLEKLILQCLAKDPVDRPQTVTEIHQIIAELREDARKIGYRPTVRFEDLASLDLGFDLPAEEEEQPTIPLDPDMLAELDADADAEWDDQTVARIRKPDPQPEGPQPPVKPVRPSSADDEKRGWYWQQACKKAKSIARILQREQPQNPQLTSVLTRLGAAEDLVLSLETEMALLEDRHQEADRDHREQESALRYAVVDLSIERGRLLEDSNCPAGTLHDLDFQIGQLEARINDAHQDSQRQRVLVQEQVADGLHRLENLQHRLTDEEVELVRLIRTLRPSTQSAKAHQLYDSVDSNLQRAR